MKYRDNENISKTKRAILEISEKLFAEKGFDRTGVNEIAEGAGIAKSVIYHHFKDKSDILQVLVHALSGELIDLKRSIRDKWPDHSDQAIELTLEELLSFWEANSRIATIIMMQSLKSTEEIPLFTLWDYNVNQPIENLKRTSNLNPDEIMQIIEGTFYLMFIPVYSFAILGGKWCRHYNIDSAKARQTFLTLLAETCKNKIWSAR